MSEQWRLDHSNSMGLNMTAIAKFQERALTRDDSRRLTLFTKTVGKDLIGDEIDVALEYCRIFNANPLTRDIYFFCFGKYGTDKRQVVPVIAVGHYRKIAARAGNYRPDERPARITYDEALISASNPKGILDCEVTVYRHAHGDWHPITERLRWEERAPIKEIWVNDKPSGQFHLDPKKPSWRTMPETMLAKCYDQDTEVLTSSGFQKFSSVTAPIMQVTDEGLEPISVAPFFQPYTGDMIYHDGDKSLNFCVTPNHSMVTTYGRIDAGKMYDEARSRPTFFIPRIARGRSVDATVSDAAILITAACLCDGSQRGLGGFSIAVSKDYKINRLQSLSLHHRQRVISSAGDTAELKTGRVITTTRDKTEFRFRMSTTEGLLIDSKTADIELFTQLSMRQARLFVDEMIFYDGTIDKKTGVRRFVQNEGHIANLFELMACSAGYCVSSSGRSDNQRCKTMTISDRDAAPVVRWNREYHNFSQGKNRTGLTKRKNNGPGVWCVTVPSGKIVVRRSSFSMLCGNCTEVSAIRKGWPEETAGSYSPEEMDARQTLDLTATEIVKQHESEDRLTRIGGANRILIDWVDGEPLQPVEAGRLGDAALKFIRDHADDPATVSMWWERNLHGFREYWARDKDGCLAVKSEIERLCRTTAS